MALLGDYRSPSGKQSMLINGSEDENIIIAQEMVTSTCENPFPLNQKNGSSPKLAQTKRLY